VTLLAGVSDSVILAAWFAKDFGDIARPGYPYQSMMLRHRFNWQRLRIGFMCRTPGRVLRRVNFRTALQHQCRQHLQVGEQCLTVQQFG